MKDRWLKIVLLVVIVGLVALIGSRLRFTEEQVPLPLQGEAITNPYYSAIKLSEQLRAKAAWERVFSVPSTDAVVLLSNWNWSLSHSRRERIEKWVADGGRLVVDNTLIGGAEEFEKWAGVTRLDLTKDDETKDTDDSDEADDSADTGDSSKPETDEPKQKPGRRRGNGDGMFSQPFFDSDCVDLTEDITRRALSVCGVDSTSALSSSRKLLWALRHGKKIEALRVPVGRGSVTVLNVSPFRFRQFLHADHPSLFVTATQLHHGDNLFFFTEEEHPSLLSLTWRYGAPVVLLLAALIILALWRNTSRFGPLVATPEKARRSLAEQIRGTGQFTLRFGGGRALHEALVRGLREAALRRLPGYDRMSAEERVAAVSKLTGVLASELGPALNYSGSRSPHELRNVIAVLETARRRLTMRKKNGN